jgi:TolA-binding protein
MPTFVYVGMLLMVLSGGAAYYYKTTQATILQLTENNAQLEANVATARESNERNVATIRNLEASYRQVQEDYRAIQGEFQEIRNQNNELRDRLGRHEIDALAAAKPELVERIINNASEKALRCFELLSGASLTDDERNAENARQFNSECPWIYESLVSNGVLGQPTSSGSNAN